MRQIFLSVFLVCALHKSFAASNNKNDILSELKNLRNEVRSTIADMKIFQNGILTGFHSKELDEQEAVLKKRFENKNKNFHEELEIEYNKLKRKNMDTDVCYKTATKKFDAIYENITENLGLIQFEAHTLKTMSLGINIDYLLKMGDDLIQRFNSVIEECAFLVDKPSYETNCLNHGLSALKIFRNNLKEVTKGVKEFDLSTQSLLETEAAALEAMEKLDKKSLQITNEFKDCGFKA